MGCCLHVNFINDFRHIYTKLHFQLVLKCMKGQQVAHRTLFSMANGKTSLTTSVPYSVSKDHVQLMNEVSHDRRNWFFDWWMICLANMIMVDSI